VSLLRSKEEFNNMTIPQMISLTIGTLYILHAVAEMLHW